MAVGTKFKKQTGPFEKDTIPIVLLDEAFGIFRDKCEEFPSETLSLMNLPTPVVVGIARSQSVKWQTRKCLKDVRRLSLLPSRHN